MRYIPCRKRHDADGESSSGPAVPRPCACRSRSAWTGPKSGFAVRGGRVILEPIADDWSWLDAVGAAFSEDFLAEGRQQPEEQVRPELDTLFD